MDKKMVFTRRKLLGTLGSLLGAFLLLPQKSNALTPKEIVRAWEDPEYRKSLTESQWNQLPENPAGKIENAEFSGDLYTQVSGNNCSGNNCSGNNCSGNNCSGNNCSGNNCSGNSCSGNNCSGNNCSGNNCSGRMCGG